MGGFISIIDIMKENNTDFKLYSEALGLWKATMNECQDEFPMLYGKSDEYMEGFSAALGWIVNHKAMEPQKKAYYDALQKMLNEI